MTASDLLRTGPKKLNATMWPALSKSLTLLVMAIAVMVLVDGLIGGDDLLVRLHPEFSAMVPSTSIALILVSVAVLLVRGDGQPSGPAIALSVLVGMIAAFHVLLFLTGKASPVDRFLNPSLSAEDAMSISTSASLLLASYCTVSLGRPTLYSPLTFGVAATTGLAIAFLALGVYVLDASALRGVFVLSAMSLLTTVCFILFFTALLLLRPEDNWVGLLVGNGRGSLAARRLFPVVVVGPFVLCVVALVATEQAYLNPEARLSLLAIVITAVAGAGVLRNAALENAAEKSQILEEQRVQHILDGLEAAVFAVDENGEIRFANSHARELTALADTPADWLATAEFLSLDDMSPLPEYTRPLPLVMRGDHINDFAFGYRAPDGAEKVLRLSTGQYQAQEGQLVRTLTINDITHEHTIRERLDRAERLDALGQMSGGIAHDMANVLGVIRLSSDVGRLSSETRQMHAQFDAIGAACIRGTDLTNRILTFARRQPGVAKPANIGDFVRETVALAERTIPSNISLTTELPNEETIVTCETGQLESALLNLIFNARDAMTDVDTAGKIHVRVRHENGKVLLSVEDDGPGMADGVLRKAAEPFFTTRQTKGGTGLGLAMVDAFAQQSGGELQLTSTIGKGTTATIELPLSDASSPATHEEQHARIHDLTGVHVFVVEDDQLHGEALAEALQSLGAKVSQASTGDSAVEMFKTLDAVDVLVTDILLRGTINGFAVANAIRDMDADVPVIYLSGYANRESQVHHHTPGPFLKKPVGTAQLSTEIYLSLNRSIPDRT